MFESVTQAYPFFVPFLTACATVLVAFVAIAKFRPERESLIVQASEHAVQSMQTAMENLQREVHDLRSQVLDQRALIDDLRQRTDVGPLIAILPRVQMNAEKLDAIYDLLIVRGGKAL